MPNRRSMRGARKGQPQAGRNSRRRPRGQGLNAPQGLGNGGYNSAPGVARSSILQSGFTVKSKPLFGYHARRNIQYFTSGTITSGASSAGTYVFSANGCFDPDITGTGGQPMGFDQAMVFFNHYTVRRSRVRVVFLTNSTNLRATVALSVSGSSTAVSVIENLIENGDCTFQVLEYAGAMGGTATMTRSLDVGKFQDVPEVMDDPNMRGDAASNPTEQVYYHLSVWNSASAATLSTDFQILIEYDVIFHEPRKGTLSLFHQPCGSREEVKEKKSLPPSPILLRIQEDRDRKIAQIVAEYENAKQLASSELREFESFSLVDKAR
jgi:hypothetical protein